MPSVPADQDVFHLPHAHMKKLLGEVEEHLSCTNFSDGSAYHSLLDHLHANFQQFKSHEDIENKYILDELLSRLPTSSKTHLENDLHSDNRLTELVVLVHDGLQLECSGEIDRMAYGERLKKAVANFAVDFVPHMDEEEEVFLPLLVKYFSEAELRTLTETVNELHHLRAAKNKHSQKEREDSAARLPVGRSKRPHRPSLLNLPPELLLKIFSYLSPTDLCRLSQIHSFLHCLAFDGSLWQHLHPVRWSRGHREFFPPLLVCGDGVTGEDGRLTHDLIVENDVTKSLLSGGEATNANLCLCSGEDGESSISMEEEARRLRGMLDHLLPRVGSHVLTLDLSYGTAVSNEVVFRMLRQCPNLHHLDLSHTKISDFAFRGPPSRLEFIDLTGCTMITDLALQRIGSALTPPPSHPHPHPSLTYTSASTSSSVGVGEEVEGGRGGSVEPPVKCLILSGCKLITDDGLRSLSKGASLPQLQYLDLSGLSNISEQGLSDLVAVCPLLNPELLFYCDNILEGPYADCANGCQNIGSPGLCCRQLL